MNNEPTLNEGRKPRIVWISPALDDLPLSPKAFRVYFYLVCHAAKSQAWPSYKAIGIHCFPFLSPSVAQVKAIEAVKELAEWKLICAEETRSSTGFPSNNYYLTDESEWKRPEGIQPKFVAKVLDYLEDSEGGAV